MLLRHARHTVVQLAVCCFAVLVDASLAHATADRGASEKATAEKNPAAPIVQAKAAFEKGKIPELERIISRHKNHLLAVWPDYWRLKLLLSIPSMDAREMREHTQGFVSRHPEHPLVESAQRDLINALVKRDLWAEAGEVILQLNVTMSGPQIQCTKGRLGLLPAPTPLAQLVIGNEALDTCLGLIDTLATREEITAGYLRQRFRWAAQSSQDSQYNKMAEIFRRHAKAHELGARGPDPLKTELTLGQILRLTRNDSLASQEHFRRHQKELTLEQHDYAAFAVGAALWRRSHPNAWPLMLEGWKSLSQQPDANLQNAAREAIRRNDWARLTTIVAAMSESARAEPTWQYWRAIALKETESADLAREILTGLQDDFGFYGVLARELTGSPVRLPPNSNVKLTANDRQRLDRDQGMERSYALLRAGLRAEAVQEWSAAMRNRSDAELIQAALHARDAGFFDRAIAAADRTRTQHDFHLRFPTPYKDTVLPAAKQAALDPWWVLGLIRQESRFISDIRSSVGASGLMQIMPATGSMLAKNIGMKNTRQLKLTDVNLNVRLGTTYMRQLQDRFGGSALLASAAYNAGPSRAQSWRSALPKKIEGAAFAESIPFPETRDYVKRVLTNAVLYNALHNGGSVPSLRQLLGEVVPGEQPS